MAKSNITTQILIDYARTYSWCSPVLGAAGYSDEPGLSFSNDIIQKVMAKPNPWKWNSVVLPPFETNPYQQDYPTNISQNTMGWLESATQIDINNLTQLPPTQIPVQCVDRLLPTYATGLVGKICWIPNSIAQYGVWPGINVLYTDPITDTTTGEGGPSNNPRTAILDPNGNIQLVVTYGTTGSSGPLWPAANAAAGTITNDGSVQWQVQDPNGVAIRLDVQLTANAQVWQINAIFQMKPPFLSSITQTFAPIPDDLAYLLKQGFLTFCYKQGDAKMRAQFQDEFKQWMMDIQEAMGASDREDQEYGFHPCQPIQSGGSGQAGSYGYVGWPGWSSGGG